MSVGHTETPEIHRKFTMLVVNCHLLDLLMVDLAICYFSLVFYTCECQRVQGNLEFAELANSRYAAGSLYCYLFCKQSTFAEKSSSWSGTSRRIDFGLNLFLQGKLDLAAKRMDAIKADADVVTTEVRPYLTQSVSTVVLQRLTPPQVGHSSFTITHMKNNSTDLCGN